MPTLADLRVRFSTPRRTPPSPAGADEILVVDSRSTLSPAQVVEQKLRQALCASRQVAGVFSGRRRKKASH
ncbi:MAG: hypothetical protein L0211_22485 [Planctomycetaceae bacterium]|nr:hypothetical protein [Planctomycetaceae bacterium]